MKKKNHFNVFWNEKYSEKQPQSHFQTDPSTILVQLKAS